MSNHKRQRQPRQKIDLEQLKNDPQSLLGLKADDPVLRKLRLGHLS